MNLRYLLLRLRLFGVPMLRRKPKPAKICSIYFRDDNIYAVASDRTSYGAYILSDRIWKLTPNAGRDEIGGAVLKALNSPQKTIENPGRPNDIFAPLLSASGAKSWKRFEKESVLVKVHSYGRDGSVYPMKRDSKGSYYLLEEEKRTVPHEELVMGEAVLKCRDLNQQ